MPPRVSPPASALPPGPGSPAWWQLVRFAGDPLRLLDECQRRYGDTFTLDVAGNGRFVMLSDPEAAREVFRGDPEVLHSGEANSLFTATVGRHSVLVLDGAPHARQRRVVVPPLKGERMRAFFDAMRLETLEAVRAWPVGSPFPALPGLLELGQVGPGADEHVLGQVLGELGVGHQDEGPAANAVPVEAHECGEGVAVPS